MAVLCQTQRLSGSPNRIYAPLVTQFADHPRRRPALCRCDRLSKHSPGHRRQGEQAPAGQPRRLRRARPRRQPAYSSIDPDRPRPRLLQRVQPDCRCGDCPDSAGLFADPGGKPAGAAVPARCDHSIAGAVRADRHSADHRRRAGHPRAHSIVDPRLRHVHHRRVPVRCCCWFRTISSSTSTRPD